MIVYIANPLYDAVFKRIMEEERIAKTFLSAILQREVVSIKICQDGSAISKAIAFRYLRWDLLPA